MIFYYSFGKYRFSVECDSDIERYLNNAWKKYETANAKKKNDVCIRIASGSMPKVSNHTDMWSYSEKNENVCAVFSENNSPRFALVYGRNSGVIDVILNNKTSVNIRLSLHYALMTAFSKSCVGVHGVTVICGDKLVILSAPSGTGKTTLSNLLRKYQNAAVINGDYALLSVDEDGTVYFEPTPFCGSSEICHNYRFTLDRIVYLEQSEQNVWRDLSPQEACASLFSNCFMPIYDMQARERILSNALKIVEYVPASCFAFAPNEAAAEIFAESLKKF